MFEITFVQTKLSHDAYVIQIRRLKMQAKTDVEKILDVFSQVKYKTNNSKVSNYTGDISDPRVARIINRLNQAKLEEDLKAQIWLEEDVDRELDALNDELHALNEELEKLREANQEAATAVEQERIAKEQERAAKESLEMQLSDMQKQIAFLTAQLNQKPDN